MRSTPPIPGGDYFGSERANREEGKSQNLRLGKYDGHNHCGNYRNSDRQAGIRPEYDESPYRNAGSRPKNGYALANPEDNPDPCRQEIGNTHHHEQPDRT